MKPMSVMGCSGFVRFEVLAGWYLRFAQDTHSNVCRSFAAGFGLQGPGRSEVCSFGRRPAVRSARRAPAWEGVVA